MSKNNKKEDKGKKQFKKFLRIYAGVLALATVIVCIILWSKLKKYQNRYDKAEAASNPDIYVTEFTGGLNQAKFLEYINKFGINVDEGINPAENHAEYFADCINTSGVEFKRSENFKKLLPVYDIYAGDTRIAVISLKSEGKNDEFGFHGWTLKDMAFDTDRIEYSNIEITVPGGSVVSYNGQVLSEEYIKSNGASKDPVAAKVEALGISVPDKTIYGLKSTFGNKKITVTDSNGEVLSPVVEGNKYDYTSSVKEMPAEIESRVLETIDSYIYTIYSKKSFEETSRYIEYGSEAYSIIADVLASVAWGWKPETVDILEQKVSDYVTYSDNVFACSYYGKIYKYKEGSMESGEETFNYRLLFRKYDGQWYLNYFVIV